MTAILILPDPSITGKFAHAQDTFRELGRAWAEQGLVELVYSTKHMHPYLKLPDITVCLFDRPIFQLWRENVDCRYVLFGNPAPPAVFQHESAWIFWGRHPKKLHVQAQHTVSYSQRDTLSIFAGKIENDAQKANRTQSKVDWSKHIQDFSCPVNGNRKYNQDQYLARVQHSRYGLCLPGFGNKCNREIELMALGTVPIVTPGVDISGYYRPPQENVHYIFAENGKELEEKVSAISPEKWTDISTACTQWYQENCSPQGAFHTTIEIIDNWRKQREG